MIKKYQDFIKEEVGLSLPDLAKPSPDGIRGDTLVKKIKDEEPFEIEKGEKIIVDRDKSIEDDRIINKDIIKSLTDRRGNFSLDKAEKELKKCRLYRNFFVDKKEKNGKFNTFKLNQLSKTQDFGSTKGSSAGSKITRSQESIQTFLLAYTAQSGYFPELDELQNIIQEEIDNPRYNNFYKVESLTSELSDVRTYYETWKWTTKNFLEEFYEMTNYEFHQIGSRSELIELIFNLYSKCCKKSFGNIINISKWNPSDIWVVNQSSLSKVMGMLNKINPDDETAFIKLNNLMNYLFEEGSLFGVSLKKISRSESIRKKLIINGEANRPSFKLKKSEAIDFNINNKTIILYVDKFLENGKNIGTEKITISNNSSGYANINLEITSISSRQGKCSLTTINNFLNNKGEWLVETYSNLKDLSTEDQEEIINNATNNLGDSLFKRKEMSLVKDLKESDIISQIQGITLCEILYDDIAIGNKIINNILLYALSIEWSFDDDANHICPKYYRIIEYNQQS